MHPVPINERIEAVSTEDQPARAPAAPSMTPRGAARRRLTKAGLGAASVLWSLDSRATMKPMICVSASAALSGGLSSSYVNQPVECSGRSPGYWKNHDGWPCASNTPFNDVFGCSGANSNTYGKKTLQQIVSGCDFDRYNLGCHLVATYLNVLSERISFLSVQTLQNIWTQLQSKGYYEPAKGVFWGVEQTKRYLEATHD